MEIISDKMVNSRGVIWIIYSTTTNTSKNASYQLQSILEEMGFSVQVACAGDINYQQFFLQQKTVIFMLSTFGNGDSPDDAVKFWEWLKVIDIPCYFQFLSYSILAFGNSNFEHHCGFGRKVREVFIKYKGLELSPLQTCDSKSSETSFESRFIPWSEIIIPKLIQLNPFREMKLSELSGGWNTTIYARNNDQAISWENEDHSKLSAQFIAYLRAHRAELIDICEMRKDYQESGRSTLQIRLKFNEDVQLWPGCHLNIYPQNPRIDSNQMIEVNNLDPFSKKPFPKMPLTDLSELINLNQICNCQQIKAALSRSKASLAVINKYKTYLKSDMSQKIRVNQMINQLEVGPELFYCLGINTPRTYSLASWTPNTSHPIIEICVSLAQNGLTSKYFKQRPKFIKCTITQSLFPVPNSTTTGPLILIANGSGIAPFRSITAAAIAEKIPVRIYFGIQDMNKDYYFQDDWNKWEKEGLIQMIVAESRKDPDKKVYVQDLLEKDTKRIHEHIFQRQGSVFICGGSSMGKAVSTVLFSAVVIECKFPYKAFNIINQLKSKRKIVQETYDS